MSLTDGFTCTIFGVDAARWDVHGPNAGLQGVTIGKGQLAGILDAPLESAWAETARGGGARHIRDRYGPRDMTVGFHIDGLGMNEPVRGSVAAAFARSLTSPPYRWSPSKRHARIAVTTDLSGMRQLRQVRGTEIPEIDTGRDILKDQYENALYNLRAGIPWWHAGTLNPSWETSGVTGSGTVTVENPGDVPAAYSIILTPGDWTISDPSWSGEIGEVTPGGKHADRTIEIHVPASAGGAVLSRDPRKLPVAAADGSNLISAQQGRFLVYDLPPWTPPTELEISVRDAPAGGARAEYRIEENYTRAWGMEAPLPGEIEVQP